MNTKLAAALQEKEAPSPLRKWIMDRAHKCLPIAASLRALAMSAATCLVRAEHTQGGAYCSTTRPGWVWMACGGCC